MPDTWFRSSPGDSVWLRAGQPLVAGEGDADVALFPPTPWTWQGLIRTRLLFGARTNLDDKDAVSRQVGPPDSLPAGWSIRGPFPTDGAHIWLPAPRFLFRRGQKAPLRAWELPTERDDDVLAAGPGAQIHPVPRTPPGARAIEAWITADNLRWALGDRDAWTGDVPVDGALPPCVTEELRTGVSLDGDSTAADGMLYGATHFRFQEGGGLVGALLGGGDGRHLASGHAPFGRGGRVATFHPHAAKDHAWLDGRAAIGSPDASDRMLVVLLSAAHDQPTPPGATLLQAWTAPGEPVGGFDRRGFTGRPVRATWAAGSAWLWSLPSDPTARTAAIATLLHPRSDEERFGFGQRVVAHLPPLQD